MELRSSPHGNGDGEADGKAATKTFRFTRGVRGRVSEHLGMDEANQRARLNSGTEVSFRPREMIEG